MIFRNSWLLLPATLLLAGCGGASGGGSGSVAVFLQGRYEKRDLGPAGFSGDLVTRPTRHAYTEVVEDATGDLLAAGYLDGEGRGIADLPEDAVVRVAIFADYQVPNTPEDGSFFMNGSVKRTGPSAHYVDAQAFNRLPEWAVTSDAFRADSGGTLTLTALERTKEAGAFNVADQGVTFAVAVRGLDPALRLPDLHTFWDPGDPAAATTYPAVAVDAQGFLLRQTPAMGGRPIFQAQVRHRGVPGSNVGDGYADGPIMESFTHLLFADYSRGDGSSGTILRRDNDPVAVDWNVASESTVAFVDGYSDFLSTAFRNATALTFLDESGLPATFRLDDPSYPAIGAGGEFHRGSVAINLHQGWRQDLGGGEAGLRSLWDAARAATPGAYLDSPLGCYPAYLTGLKGILGPASPSWQALRGRMASDVTSPAYLEGTALWLTRSSLPFTANGTLQTYASTYYYDRNQSQAYRFSLPWGGPLELQLVPTSGQDFFLELIGSSGLVAASLEPLAVPGARTLTLSNLPAGTYVARVRAGYTTATLPNAGYTLSVR